MDYSNPTAPPPSAHLLLAAAAAIVDEWHPIWTPTASARVDQLLDLADHLAEEGRF